MEDSLFAVVLLPVALAVIMVTLGLSLTVDDFRRVITYPRGVAIGMLNLALISPALAFGIAELLDLEPALAVGLVLLGASPGGTMANMLTHLARGDTALSVTMTAVSSVAAVITVPLFLELSTEHFGATGLDDDVGMLSVVARVLLITVLPLSAGMWLRARSPERVAELEPRAKRIALAVFICVVIGAIVAEHERVLDNLDDVALAAIMLNLAAMAISFTIARLARLDDRQSTAIAIELGVHNATLAIAIGASIAAVLTIPAAVYSAFMFISAGLFARLMYRRNSASQSPVSA
ncbi:MAG: bile acid:sodium symporter family protein [Solirubrobacterales bacterium]